jgi:two-component system, LytTR family, response regulator
MPPATELAASARTPGQQLDRIVIKDGTRVHILALAKIEYVEAQDDYVAVHSGGKTYLKQQTLSAIERALDPQRFVRVHRSYVVNVERIEKVEPITRDSRVAVLRDGTRNLLVRPGISGYPSS